MAPPDSLGARPDLPVTPMVRMPHMFGAAPGPRQQPDGTRYANVTGPHAVAVWARYAVTVDQIAPLLPPGFAPASQPDLMVEIRNLTDVPWLAGRGYSIATVSTAARWNGSDPIEGRYQLVLWENHADPIITGREELGFAKVFGDISPVVITGDHATATTSWEGHEFLSVTASGLAANSIPPTPDQLPPGGPGFHWKYIPRTGDWGTADVSYPVVTPVGGPKQITDSSHGAGSFAFRTSTWNELPTLFHIVNTLAAITLGESLGGGVVHTVGSSDFAHQAPLT